MLPLAYSLMGWVKSYKSDNVPWSLLDNYSCKRFNSKKKKKIFVGLIRRGKCTIKQEGSKIGEQEKYIY